MTVIFSDDYHGPRHRYASTLRPVQSIWRVVDAPVIVDSVTAPTDAHPFGTFETTQPIADRIVGHLSLVPCPEED